MEFITGILNTGVDTAHSFYPNKEDILEEVEKRLQLAWKFVYLQIVDIGSSFNDTEKLLVNLNNKEQHNVAHDVRKMFVEKMQGTVIVKCHPL